MTFDNLLLDRDGPLASITINRPAVLNALNAATLQELQHAIVGVTEDDAVRVVVITGHGDKSFVAGADIGELASLDPVRARSYSRRGQHVFDLVERMGKPVIAAVNGYALGGGCELAMACTLRLASDTAVFGQPEIDLGLLPGFGGTQRLTRLVGKGAALDLLLTGRRVSAAEALSIGLVNRVVPSAQLMTEVRTLAAQLAAKAPIALRCILEAAHEGGAGGVDDGQSLESALFGVVASTDDMREGVAAFLGKRAPEFRGR